MADLKNVQNPNSVYVATVATAEAVDLNLDRYDTFHFTSDTGAGAPALTWKGVVAGRKYTVDFFWTLVGTTDYLKPTNSASTNSDGTTLIFHSVGTGAANAAWPTFSTTQNLVDWFRWVSPNGVDFYLVAFTLGLDE